MASALDKLKEFDFAKFSEELQNFDSDDLKNIGTASVGIRVLLIVVLLIIVIAGGYKLLISPKIKALDKAIAEEATLRKDFDFRQRKAANLEAYKEQLAEMERSFGAMLRQLPEKTDVQNIVVDLSQTGARNSLKVELLKPEDEITKDFYAELPIKLKVFGKFHELARFVSDVAALPRIVTLHDIKMSIVDETKPTELSMEMTAKTYRYLE